MHPECHERAIGPTPSVPRTVDSSPCACRSAPPVVTRAVTSSEDLFSATFRFLNPRARIRGTDAHRCTQNCPTRIRGYSCHARPNCGRPVAGRMRQAAQVQETSGEHSRIGGLRDSAADRTRDGTRARTTPAGRPCSPWPRSVHRCQRAAGVRWRHATTSLLLIPVLFCATLAAAAAQQPAQRGAPPARRRAGAGHESRQRRERQPAPPRRQDRPHLQLRRDEGQALHAAGSAGAGERHARDRCADVGAAAARPRSCASTRRDLRPRAGDRAEGDVAGDRDRDRRARRDGHIKRIAGTIGSAADAPKIALTLYTPPNAKGRVPIVLLVNFGGGRPIRTAAPSAARRAGRAAAHGRAAGRGGDPRPRLGLRDDLLSGHPARSQDESRRRGDCDGARRRAARRRADDWGSIAAWSWGISRTIDYLVTDPSVNAKRIAIQGHSRLGKTVLWASANDPRIAAVFSSCAGEMGSALSRRDWGETVDDMAQNFAWQFARRCRSGRAAGTRCRSTRTC